MPANYLQIVQNLPDHAKASAEYMLEQQRLARCGAEKLFDPALDLAALAAKIDRAREIMPALYTARPLDEPFTLLAPLPETPPGYTLLGIDGSQILPSRHQAIAFGLINLGWIGIEPGSRRTPWTNKQTEIIPYEELFNANGSLISDAEVDLRRDLAERELIPRLFAGEEPELRLALSDGPLEVHRSREDALSQPRIEERIAALEQELASRRLVHAGYIDKPGSAMLSRMLAIGGLDQITPEAVNRALQTGIPVSDLQLFGERLSEPGQRSAVFEIVSQRPRRGGVGASERQRVFCFYLCVGRDELTGQVLIARVEFAEWVAMEPRMVDQVHAVVFADTQGTPAHPFPYVLTRAHEEAVIGISEQNAINKLLKTAWRAAGLDYGSVSAKAFGKESLGG